MSLNLSILEFGTTAPPGLYAHQIIEYLFNYVEKLEDLGYKRFWMSEHYSPEFAWYSPEILLPLLVGSTEKIKIGQAGVLLKYHSAFRIAHNFTMLSALFPDRIDLGFSSAGASDEALKALTGRSDHLGKDFFNKQLEQVFYLLQGKSLNLNVENSLMLPLQGTAKPDTWLLGITKNSIPNAIKYKANFCLSLFHIGAKFSEQKEIIKQYKEKYCKQYEEVPLGVATIKCLCSEDRKILRKMKAEVLPFSQKEGYIIGTPAECEEQLLRLAETLSLDEIVLNLLGSSLKYREMTTQLVGKRMLKHQNKMEPLKP